MVVNGQKNVVKVIFDNKSKKNYTVDLIGGHLVIPDNPSSIVRNLTAYSYSRPAPAMDHVEITYNFYAEFQPQELDLLLFVFFSDEKETRYRGVGYNGTITIVEPEHSLFDIQLLFLYVILLGVIGGVGFLIFQAFFGGIKSKKGKKRVPSTKPEDMAAGGSSSADLKYDESWIPEHHLKPQPTRSSPRIKKKNEKKVE